MFHIIQPEKGSDPPTEKKEEIEQKDKVSVQKTGEGCEKPSGMFYINAQH